MPELVDVYIACSEKANFCYYNFHVFSPQISIKFGT